MKDAKATSTRPLLALDTATSLGGVAVGWDGTVLAEVTLGEASRHSENLLPAIEYALSRAGCGPRDIGGVVVGAGPGSFTGVRIAAATAKAWVHAWSVPLYAWSSLAMLAVGCGAEGDLVVPLFDARRDEVYAAAYRRVSAGLEAVLAPVALPVMDLLGRIPPVGAVFAGEGAVLHAERIREVGGRVVTGPASVPRPANLLWLASLQPAAGRVEQPSVWEPLYVRASGAQRMRPA